MKHYFFVAIFGFLFFFAQCQTHVFIDVNGDTISKGYYQSKFRKGYPNLRSWSWVGKKRRQFHQLKTGRYNKGYFDYNLIKTELEKIIPYHVTEGSTIIIEYYFKDDLCSDWHKDNKWTSSEIRQRKSFLNPKKKDLNDRGIFFISLFENGIKLRNRPKSENEYFFSDKNNFFKENLFKSPTTCGSHGAIKTNNQTLVQHGENSADHFAENLNEERWSLFFPSVNKE